MVCQRGIVDAPRSGQAASESFASQKDHESQFWTHDIHVASSTNNAAAEIYFKSVAGRRMAASRSYGGWQENVLFQNAGNHLYHDTAFVLGVAMPEDSRCVVAEDFDGDGRMDLAVTTFEQWPVRRQRLVVYRNEMPDAGNWLGFRFNSREGARNPTGARVEIETSEGRQTRWIVTGDSYRSQSSPSAHFGIGRATIVRSARVVWPDGSTNELPARPINRWHPVNSRALSPIPIP